MNSDLLKQLRNLTQAGMKDCHDALREADGDIQKAVDIIKIKGKNIVSGREGNSASEGVVCLSTVGNFVSMVEVNCQTDFIAKSPDFISFAKMAVNSLSDSVLFSESFNHNNDALRQIREDLISKTKENIVVRRWWVEQAFASNAKVFSYVHSNNKIGVLLTLLAPTEEIFLNPKFIVLGNDLAMQAAAMSPLAISQDKLDPDLINRQKLIFETQLTELKKPQAAWPKILDGKFNKWYTEVCLLEQESVVVNKTQVKQVIKNLSDELGGEIAVVNMIRCQVGEGVEQNKGSTFAEEVAKLSGVHQHSDGHCGDNCPKDWVK